MVWRMIDIFVGIVGLVLSTPALLLVAILVKCDSPGPILYNRQVVGRNGRPFSLYGFRTMLAGTENVAPEQRLTRVGRWVRNFSLDHLPQLMNLLKGDLTIIGPRAMEREVVDLRDPVWQTYVTVTPGLLSYAVQKLGRNWTPSRRTNPDLNQELELEYLKERSALSDIGLLVEWVKGLARSSGNVKARGETDPSVTSRLER